MTKLKNSIKINKLTKISFNDTINIGIKEGIDD
jgi:hypothetical protein